MNRLTNLDRRLLQGKVAGLRHVRALANHVLGTVCPGCDGGEIERRGHDYRCTACDHHWNGRDVAI